MSSCVPKHIICNWYTPNFIPSVESCTLKIDTENVARLEAGGTFFRSINVGTQANNIQISCEWQESDGGSPETWTTWSGSLSTPFVGRVEVVVTNGGSPIEIYHAAQTVDLGSPETIGTSSAIDTIRALISGSPISSQLITMPEIDTQGSPIWDASLRDAEYLSEFILTNLSGGYSAPSDQTFLDSIRTGPALTMVYVSHSDYGIEDGTMTELGEVRYWNGACWKGYNALNPDCIDPSHYSGSPLTGSPELYCNLGPESDC